MTEPDKDDNERWQHIAEERAQEALRKKPEMLPELDEPPKHYVDSHEVIEQATDEEIEKGVRLGRQIDPDDDEDNGL